MTETGVRSSSETPATNSIGAEESFAHAGLPRQCDHAERKDHQDDEIDCQPFAADFSAAVARDPVCAWQPTPN